MFALGCAQCLDEESEMVVVGGQLFELMDGRGEWGGRGGSGDAEGVDCGSGRGVVRGVDADGVGEGEGGKGF